MSSSLTGRQVLGFAVDVSPDGIRPRALLEATDKPSSADRRGADARASSPAADGSPATVAPVASPTLLGMAASMTRSMAKFAASGFKTVDEATHQVRTEQCLGCAHHNGSRCQVCGCFFDKKARLPHEDCPIGKWPA